MTITSQSTLTELRQLGEATVRAAEADFRNNLGAKPAVIKNAATQDFATDIDLNLEQQFRAELHKASGFPVLGEEFGFGDGAIAITRRTEFPETFWCVDPVDGTSNYAVGNPMCGILLSLVHQRRPVVAVTSLPLLGEFYSAQAGGPLYHNDEVAPQLPTEDPEVVQITFGSILSGRRGHLPGQYRQNLLFEIGVSYPRMRVTGSCGADLAFTAAGKFAGALTFSPNIWDNAAGILLVEAAGGTVTDLHGKPWRAGTAGMVAAAPSVHSTLMKHINSVPRPYEATLA